MSSAIQYLTRQTYLRLDDNIQWGSGWLGSYSRSTQRSGKVEIGIVVRHDGPATNLLYDKSKGQLEHQGCWAWTLRGKLTISFALSF